MANLIGMGAIIAIDSRASRWLKIQSGYVSAQRTGAIGNPKVSLVAVWGTCWVYS